MTRNFGTLLASVLCGAIALPLGAAAEGDDLIQRFQSQLEVEERGLSLAPISSTGSTAAGASASASSGGGSSGGGSSAAPAPLDLVPEEASYRAMPAGAEVNIQIQFALGSASIADSESAKLATICNAMQSLDGVRFHIFGHTDASGSRQYNLRLSRQRASTVRAHLVEACGIAADRLEAFGVGEEHPIQPEAPRAPENRRVEFQAVG